MYRQCDLLQYTALGLCADSLTSLNSYGIVQIFGPFPVPDKARCMHRHLHNLHVGNRSSSPNKILRIDIAAAFSPQDPWCCSLDMQVHQWGQEVTKCIVTKTDSTDVLYKPIKFERQIYPRDHDIVQWPNPRDPMPRCYAMKTD